MKQEYGENMAEKQLWELTGTVEEIIYKNEKNGYSIVEVSTGEETVTVVGTLPYVSTGEELRIIGTWTTHPTFGNQFKAETCERSRPASAAAILKYLSSGAIKGIGPSTAANIVSEFGEQALHVIEHEPERLCALRGITAVKAQAIHDEFQRIFGIKELMLYLQQYEITPVEAIRIWKTFGNDARAEIERDPYCLCTEEIGISFPRADTVAQQRQLPKENTCRLQSGLLYVLTHNAGNGHTCLPQDKLLQAASALLGIAPEELAPVLQEMLDTRMLVCAQFAQRPYLFTNVMYRAETYIAERVGMMLQYPAPAILGSDGYLTDLEEKYGITYAQKQKEAVCMALERGVLILTGGPGTGKTTTLNAMIQILQFEGEKVLLGAPTGRAAKRMTEVTGCEAKTIHRLLQVEWSEQERPRFIKNERNLLDCDTLILDEVSMIDASLFESVLRALPLGCRLILVGDTDQLPSVGAGNVLGDLIASQCLPVVQLSEIFRQSMQSCIVTNAHQIVSGKMPDLQSRNSDFFFLPCSNTKKLAEMVTDLYVRRLPQTYGYVPQNDIQVLCPGRKGALGTTAFNERLQAVVNPPQQGKAQVTVNQLVLRQGDKVMQSRNNYNLPWSKADGTCGEGVYNGDIGVLVELDPKNDEYFVQIDDKLVRYHAETLAELELAYAITVHKSQGNEFSAVILPLLGGTPHLLYRNLLYTGITRAKNLLILPGSRATVQAMVENNRKTKRYTGLLHFLVDENDA